MSVIDKENAMYVAYPMTTHVDFTAAVAVTPTPRDRPLLDSHAALRY